MNVRCLPDESTMRNDSADVSGFCIGGTASSIGDNAESNVEAERKGESAKPN